MISEVSERSTTSGVTDHTPGPVRLSGLDASFVYNETATEHMHTLKLGVFDPPEDLVSFEEMRIMIAERMWRWPAFTRRLVDVPGQLHHPVWVPVGEFDLDYHIRRATVPEPGDQAALDVLVGRLAGWPLDRRRPLWQLWVIEGRSDGRLAVLVKLHHCVADGLAANALLAGLMSEPEDSGAAVLRRAVRTPTRRELLVGAAGDLWRDLRDLPRVLGDLRRAVIRRRRALAELGRTGADVPPRPILDTPVTSFNRAITAARSVATTTLELEPVLAAKNRHSVSMNDVFLTLVGGALIEVLASTGEHPAGSLTASVPVSAEPPGGTEPRRSGNKLSNLFVSLHTDISDPRQRLAAVHASTSSAKRLHDALGPEVMETLLGYTPPRPYRWAMKAYSGLDLADRHRAPVNVICSNVPGPRSKLEVSGVSLVDFYSAGPVLEGIAVNVTAWSYVDRMDVMVIACARAMPEPQRLTAALHDQLALLGA